MKVPDSEKASIPPGKVEAYLLNPDHRDGGPKALFFIDNGFEKESLIKVLFSHVRDNDYSKSIVSPYGTKYIVEGPIISPKGKTFNLSVFGLFARGPRLLI